MKNKIHKQFTIEHNDSTSFEEEVNNYLSVGWDILEGSYSKESSKGETLFSQILIWRDAADSEIKFIDNFPVQKIESIEDNKVRITKWFEPFSLEEWKVSEIKEGYNNKRYAKEGVSTISFNGEYFQKDGEFKSYYKNGNINCILYYEAGRIKGKGIYYQNEGQK